MSKTGWLTLALGMAFSLGGVLQFANSFAAEARANALSRPASSEAVRATAVVIDKNQLKSLHFHVPCVACRTRVDRTVELNKRDRTTATIFHQSRGKDPVALELAGKTVFLPLNQWVQHNPTRQETTSLRPPFAPDGGQPGQRSYLVSELILQEGQQVFIAGSLPPGSQTLAADPALALEGVLIFAGSQQQYQQYLRSTIRDQRVSGALVLALGLGLLGMTVRRGSPA